MSAPIKAGDVCRIIAGMGRGKSPNIGLTVTVGFRIYGNHGGDHSQFGPVHRCKGKGVKQLADNGGYIVTDWADIPTAWLERIDPIKTDESNTVEKDITA